VQSQKQQHALFPDSAGRVSVDLDGIEISLVDLTDLDDPNTISTWTIPEDIKQLDAGPNAVWNQAGKAFIKAQKGQAVRGLLLTPREWIDTYGKQYGITSAEYVRQMCREQSVGVNRTRPAFKTKLPTPFRAVKAGQSWLITV
jgi:hypothetical protein